MPTKPNKTKSKVEVFKIGSFNAVKLDPRKDFCEALDEALEALGLDEAKLEALMKDLPQRDPSTFRM